MEGIKKRSAEEEARTCGRESTKPRTRNVEKRWVASDIGTTSCTTITGTLYDNGDIEEEQKLSAVSTSFDIDNRGEWIYGVDLRFKGVKRMVPMCNKDKKEALVAGGIPRSALHYGDAGWELIANYGDDKRKTIQAIDFYAAAIGKFVMPYVKDKNTNVFLTCPAYFDARERQLMMQAARIAGLTDEQIKAILDEPSAGLLGALGIDGILEMCNAGRVFCVVDMGGGTMDVSVIRMSMIKGKGVARCIAVASNLCLGGDDVDAIIKNMLVDAVGDVLNDDVVRGYVQLHAKELKIAAVAADGFKGDVEGHKFSVPADKVQQRLSSFLSNGASVITEALEKAVERAPGTIVDKFVVVGGMATFAPWSERVNALAVERGSQGAGDLIVAKDPVTAVAQGVSLYAQAMEKHGAVLKIIPSSPLTIYIELVKPDKEHLGPTHPEYTHLEVLVPAGTPFGGAGPVHHLCNSHPGPTVDLGLYTGLSSSKKDCWLLGVIVVNVRSIRESWSDLPKGCIDIDVRPSFNSLGDLIVTAKIVGVTQPDSDVVEDVRGEMMEEGGIFTGSGALTEEDVDDKVFKAMLMRRLPWNEDQRIMLENAEPEDVITAARDLLLDLLVEKQMDAAPLEELRTKPLSDILDAAEEYLKDEYEYDDMDVDDDEDDDN